MIVLETNVIVESMKPNGNPAVQAWLDRQTAETLYLIATSFSELLTGIGILPDDKRKEELDAALSKLLERLLVVHGFTIATRDNAPFVAAGIPVINPWQERS